jgi:hypothetical protein
MGSRLSGEWSQIIVNGCAKLPTGICAHLHACVCARMRMCVCIYLSVCERVRVRRDTALYAVRSRGQGIGDMGCVRAVRR